MLFIVLNLIFWTLFCENAPLYITIIALAGYTTKNFPVRLTPNTTFVRSVIITVIMSGAFSAVGGFSYLLLRQPIFLNLLKLILDLNLVFSYTLLWQKSQRSVRTAINRAPSQLRSEHLMSGVEREHWERAFLSVVPSSLVTDANSGIQIGSGIQEKPSFHLPPSCFFTSAVLSFADVSFPSIVPSAPTQPASLFYQQQHWLYRRGHAVTNKPSLLKDFLCDTVPFREFSLWKWCHRSTKLDVCRWGT